MQKLISNMLRKIADNLDAGTSKKKKKGCHKVLNTINLMENGDEELSKLEAAEYIGVCRATFDNYVSNGLIPKGKNHDGTKALFWFKSDLD